MERTASLDGNRLRGRATFRDSKTDMEFEAQLRVDGSVLASYKVVAKGTGESADSVVRHHVWHPGTTESLFDNGE